MKYAVGLILGVGTSLVVDQFVPGYTVYTSFLFTTASFFIWDVASAYNRKKIVRNSNL